MQPSRPGRRAIPPTRDPRLRTAARVAGLLLLVCAAARGDGLDECSRRVLARPDVYEEYLCFHAAAQASGDWLASDVRLAELAPRLPFDGWALLLRGHLSQRRDELHSIDFYRRAAAAFAARGLARGEILARHNLRNLHHRRGESAAASAEVLAAVAAAERSGDPGLRAQALVLRGTHQVETGGDLASAHFDLRRALDLLADAGPYAQRKLAHLALANAAFQLGRYDEAVATYERLLELTRAERDATEEATALFNIANARQRQFEDRPRPDSLDRLEPLATAALEAARRAGHRGVEIRAGALLGQVAQGRGDLEAARQRFEAALAVAREIGHPERVMICLWLLADLLAEVDSETARAQIDEATALALSTDNERHLVYAWQARMRLDWRTRPRAEAIESAGRALGAIEALAARQGDEAANVGLFGAWARDYRWLAGRRLDGGAAELAPAFATMERMRARALLAALDGAGEGRSGEGRGPEAEREADVRRELIAIQRRVLGASAAESTTAALAAELEGKEIELAALRAERDRRAPGELEPRELAGLERVRDGLGPGEVLVLYQLAPERDLYGRFAGGSWVVTLTAERSRVDRLPDPAEIEPLVALFLGLIARRDGSEAAAARRLHELLLGASLAELPAPPERLIVVPDGVLFDLPFEVLRGPAEVGDEPLGARFEIAVVPSATAWLHWRSARSAAPARSALVLADPSASASLPAPEGSEAASSALEAGFGALPGARSEGRRIAHRLRPTSELLFGAAASEGALARDDLDSFAILHLAAHAVADPRRPQRSAVHLAAASEHEDGLLQASEISRWPRVGRLVVLSACRSAAGTVGEGEGPMSLARAFQQAGARAVVASRWLLRDDEAEEMVVRLYDRLASGERLGEALRAVRAAAFAEGRPAAAWGAFVLLGESDFAPLAGVPLARPGIGALPIFGAILALLLIAAIALRSAWARRARARSPG